MALVTCKECGKEFSRSAKKCPNCGAKSQRAKIAQLVGIIAIVILAVLLYSVFKDIGNSHSKQQAKTWQQAQPVYVLDIRPDSQKSFEKICADSKAEYDKGTNDLQKSTARGNRTIALRQQGLNSANNWIGTIEALSTNNDGKGVISIKLNDNISVATWNNAFSDIGDNTLIPVGSTLFNSLSSLSKGSKVRFSGNFFSRDEKDFLKTQGIDVSDAMKNVKFLMKFTSVTLLKDIPFSTEDINLREGASKDASIIMEIKKGTSVNLLGNPAENGWVKASVDGKEGYVNSQYLTY